MAGVVRLYVSKTSIAPQPVLSAPANPKPPRPAALGFCAASTTCCGVRPPPIDHASLGRDVMIPAAPPCSSRNPSSPPPNADEYPVPRTPALAPETDGLFGLTRRLAHSRCVLTMSESMRALESGVA